MIALLLLLACSPDGTAETDAPEAVLPTVLDDPAYAFCHEAGRDALSASEWCDLLASLPEDRCPGLRATCEGAEPVQPPRGCDEGGTWGSPGRDLAGGPRKPIQRAACGEPPSWDLSGLQALLRWVAALFVALLVLVVFRFLWRWFGWRNPSEPPSEPASVAPVEEELPELDDVPALPSADLLAAARAALAAGDFGQAALLARGAALRGLGERGVLRLHRSRTDREYLRSVRKDASTSTALRTVLRAVEDHRWGGEPLDATRARSALEAAARLLAIGLLVLGLLLTPTTASAQEGWRHGPTGDAGLYDLFERYGHAVSWRLRGLDSVGDDDGLDLVVLDLTGVTPSDDDWSTLRTWVEEGHVLVVAGDASETFPELGAWTPVVPMLKLETTWAWRRAGLPDPALPRGPTYAFSDGEDAIVWATGDGAPEEDDTRASPADRQLAVVRSVTLGEGTIVGIADARLLWNGALVEPNNEVFLGDLAHAGQIIDGWPVSSPPRVQLATAAGAGSDSPARALMNAQLLPFLLQFLAWWVLVGLWRGWPFGAPSDPADAGRRDFSDHITALARRYQGARATRHAASWYARLWLARLKPSGIVLAAQRSGRSAEEAHALAERVATLARDPEGPDTDSDLELVEELWTITHRR